MATNERKPVSLGQSHALMAAIAVNVDWDSMDSETVQQFIKDPKGTGELVTRLLRGELVAAPCRDALWQTDTQKAGSFVTVGELLATAPKGETSPEDYLKDPESLILKEWEGKAVFYRKHEIRDAEGNSRYVNYRYEGGGQWSQCQSGSSGHLRFGQTVTP